MILHELQMTGGSYVEIRAGNLRPDAHRQRAGIISRSGNSDSSLTAIGSEKARARALCDAYSVTGRKGPQIRYWAVLFCPSAAGILRRLP